MRHLCKESKTSWSEWNIAGRPFDGPLFDKKNKDKRSVRSRLNQLRALKERSVTETIDCMFENKVKKRFRLPRQSPSGTTLLIENDVETNQDEVSAAWATHFEQLGSSSGVEAFFFLMR